MRSRLVYAHHVGAAARHLQSTEDENSAVHMFARDTHEAVLLLYT
jgi:hypothetical protein